MVVSSRLSSLACALGLSQGAPPVRLYEPDFDVGKEWSIDAHIPSDIGDDVAWSEVNPEEIFGEIDSNHDGVIGLGDDFVNTFKDVDSNHDGMISHDELTAAIDAEIEREVGKFMDLPQVAKQIADFKVQVDELYWEHDTNKDGTLQHDEWALMVAQLALGIHELSTGEESPDVDFVNTFKDVDSNHDGMISHDEVVAAIDAEIEREVGKFVDLPQVAKQIADFKVQVDELYWEHDTNKDGTLQDDEWALMVAQLALGIHELSTARTLIPTMMG